MAVTPFGSGRLDKLLDIIFTKQVTYVARRNQVEWDMIKKLKASDPLARSVRFRIMTELGYPSAGAGRNLGAASYAFPKGFVSNINEYEANYKLKATTVSLSYDLYEQARLAKSAKALEPLAAEMQAKADAESRIMAAEFWQDGTGVRGTAASASDASIASGRVVVTLQDSDSTRGHASLFELGDVLVVKTANASAVNPTFSTPTPSFYGYKVFKTDRKNQVVYLDIVNTALQVITTATASNIAAGNVFYRVDGQQTFADVTSNATVGDYGAATEIMPGIESLAADDGRTVFGMVMDGILRGTQTDAGTNPLDAIMIDECLGEAVNRMGPSRFKYKQMIMDDFSHRQLIDSRETDRRFISYQDNTRGTTYFGYSFRDTILRAVISEYVRRRIWFLPELSGSEKVLEFHGTDWTDINVPGGSGTYLGFDTTAGQYTNQMNKFKSQRGVLINRVPGAIACIRNYTLSV